MLFAGREKGGHEKSQKKSVCLLLKEILLKYLNVYRRRTLLAFFDFEGNLVALIKGFKAG